MHSRTFFKLIGPPFASTASLVGSVCDLVMEVCGQGNTMAGVRAVLRLGEGEHLPTDTKELAKLAIPRHKRTYLTQER